LKKSQIQTLNGSVRLAMWNQMEEYAKLEKLVKAVTKN